MGKLMLALIAAAFLAGCQTADDALTTGTTQTAVTGSAASAIAGDMAGRLAEQIGSAGTTTIKMKNDQSEFATALEAALKRRGYTVVADNKIGKDMKPLELAYAIDSIDDQVLAGVTTPSIAISRAYSLTADGATPVSPLSVMQRN
ncbi:putative outer membrane protein [Rhizobium mesoamericanum]|uniref:conjugal transfer protein TrbH n=1 Tax=Rhizobium mesoamericanum TaxID=1079800 RepID=UPI0027814C18|nr:conjugal transfer protein TrbH [Rhizobium mesoamericanum]MDQ0562237.1 putative outer membrane protein [Rhizobium mesoamericanum]